jgi:multidrug efflux pump
MAWPITASTATTLCAFLPLLFWPGMIGEFMKYLPITLVATLAASLAMALLFVPATGSLLGAVAGDRKIGLQTTLASDDPESLARLRGITARYIGLLRGALHHPGKILVVAAMLLAGTYILYDRVGRGVEFFPEVEPTQAAVNIHARGDLSVQERDALVRRVEQRVLGMPELESVYTRSGLGFGGETEEDVIGRIQLRFVDWTERRPASAILAEVRERTADLAGIIVEPQAQESGITEGKPIQLELSSLRPDLLREAVQQIRSGFVEIGDLIDVSDSRPIGGIDWRIQVDRAQAARFGADITTVGNTIQLVTNGIMIGDYRPDDADDEVDIRIRFPDSDRNLGQLDRLRVNSARGSVPVSNFMTRTAAPRVGNIDRTDGRRVLTISADVPDGVLVDDKVQEIQRWLATADLDPAVDVKFRGESEDQQEAEEFLTKAFGAALFLMAIILVTQFNSFYQALLVLSAVLFSTVGVLVGLLITDQPFGVVMSGIGVIALAGIVVNNNIVLIDTFNIIRRQGNDVVQAALLTCAQRLRPVLLTTITTILGLLPMALGVNIDLFARDVQIGGPTTQWWTQLATAVAGGLAFATLLTLVLTPCLLVLGDSVNEQLAGLRQRLAERLSMRRRSA